MLEQTRVTDGPRATDGGAIAVAAYSDGGVIGPNPSAVGGTWCYCLVDAAGRRVRWESGAVTPADVGLPRVTNNLTELLAALRALEALPDGWAGTLFTDSQVTRGRMRGGQKFNGIPDGLRERVRAVRARLGAYQVILLGGHPSRAELAAGKRRAGLPVSSHNVFCDRECGRQARRFAQAAVEARYAAHA